MRTNLLKNLVLTAVLATGLASAKMPPVPTDPDAALAAKITHEIRMYPRYSIWDNVNVRVQNGSVELVGQVSQPYKKDDLQRIIAHVPGVTSMTNGLQVLPLSPFDDQLRIQVARAIFRDPVLSRYSMEPIPSIHIIVDNGHVALEGVVASDMEKNLAGMRANAAGLSFGQVENHLRVENSTKPSHS